EVGAVDSIIDIVGSVYGLLKLKADRFVASPLNVGSGTVKVAHGVLPVPAPATARLLRGVPAYGEGAGELLTPTGALLITDFACEYGTLPAMAIEGIGYGAGTREIEGRPNVLRILSGTAVAATARERVVVLECEIDDLSPQVFGTLIEHLLKAGALDAYLTAISMKKGRPGILVTAIADPAREDAIAEVLFSETTTLGLRRLPWERTVLDRETIAVSTRYGELTMKIGCRAGRVYNVQPEFDECVKAAQAHGVPVKEVWAEAVSAYRQSASARR
ncbi:MAG: LarC family nickel insertion protein, partial [Vicinamibacteria bacterium]|nr:LarC family nickel insertion protein [Vicinamibacteria bacterium]